MSTPRTFTPLMVRASQLRQDLAPPARRRRPRAPARQRRGVVGPAQARARPQTRMSRFGWWWVVAARKEFVGRLPSIWGRIEFTLAHSNSEMGYVQSKPACPPHAPRPHPSRPPPPAPRPTRLADEESSVEQSRITTVL